MVPQTPIAGMALEEAERSLLSQYQGIFRVYQTLVKIDVASLNIEEVRKTIREFDILGSNIDLTRAHIIELGGLL